MTINKKAPTFRESAHVNHMASPSYEINDPIARLRVAASSCFFGEPQYYHESEEGPAKKGRTGFGSFGSYRTPTATKLLGSTSGAMVLSERLGKSLLPNPWYGMTPAQMLEKAIDEALDYDVEKTLALAVELRNVENIRVTPQVILVRAANHPKAKGTGLVRRYALQIVKRADEPSTGLAYQLSKYGTDKPVPMGLRKAYKRFLENSKEYALAKYRMEGRMVKTVDVVNLVRPKVTKGSAVDKLVRGELTNTGETWEAIISAEGSTKESWTKALDVMGHMALLRNLRNLIKVGVPNSLWTKKLVEGAPEGKQIPFRYWSAFKAVEEAFGGKVPGDVLDAIEESMIISLGNLPKLPGKAAFLVDNSGSAVSNRVSSMSNMTTAEVGNLSGVIGAMLADEGYVGVFGDKLEMVSIRKKASIMEQLKNINKIGAGIGGGTENGVWLFLKDAIDNKTHWDTITIMSDMQAGHGGLYGTDSSRTEYVRRGFGWPMRAQMIDVPKLIAEYRRTVNPNVQVFLVQTAGYQDTLVPEFFDKTYILGGWGTSIFQFMGNMLKLGKAEKPQQ